MLEYGLDNSSSTLSLTQTTVALHYLSQGIAMVTGEGEDEANFQLDNQLFYLICVQRTKKKRDKLALYVVNPILFILNLDDFMSPYNTFSIYIWPWRSVQRYVRVVHTYVA